MLDVGVKGISKGMEFDCSLDSNEFLRGCIHLKESLGRGNAKFP